MPELRRIGGQTFPEQTAPATPAANYVTVYAKSDGFMYAKDDAGVETRLSNSADTEFMAWWGAF